MRSGLLNCNQTWSRSPGTMCNLDEYGGVRIRDHCVHVIKRHRAEKLFAPLPVDSPTSWSLIRGH